MSEHELPGENLPGANQDDHVDRRQLLKQGVKLAYVVPVVLATMTVNSQAVASGGPPQPAPAPPGPAPAPAP